MSVFTDKVVAFERKCGDAILSASGSRVQFELCIFLVSLIPLFALAFLALTDLSITTRFAVFALVLPVVFVGYAIVSRYPRAIKILRKDLEDIAQDDLPETIELKTSDADIQAIKDSLDEILVHTKEKIARIEEQQNALVQMERDKVMYESIGAACHHMGQPAAVLSTNLKMMRDHKDEVNAEELLHESIDAIKRIVEVLQKFNSLQEYKTTTYMPDSESGHGDVKILEL